MLPLSTVFTAVKYAEAKMLQMNLYASLLLFLYTLSGGIPHDGTPVQHVHSYKIGLVISYYLLATVGIAFTCVCLAFNCVFRKFK